MFRLIAWLLLMSSFDLSNSEGRSQQFTNKILVSKDSEGRTQQFANKILVSTVPNARIEIIVPPFRTQLSMEPLRNKETLLRHGVDRSGRMYNHNCVVTQDLKRL